MERRNFPLRPTVPTSELLRPRGTAPAAEILDSLPTTLYPPVNGKFPLISETYTKSSFFLINKINTVSRLMSSTAPSVNMNMAGMNMTGMNMSGMNMNMSMSGIGAACGMSSEPKQCGVQFPLHAQRRKRRVLFTQAQVSHFSLIFSGKIVFKKRCLPHNCCCFSSICFEMNIAMVFFPWAAE